MIDAYFSYHHVSAFAPIHYGFGTVRAMSQHIEDLNDNDDGEVFVFAEVTDPLILAGLDEGVIECGLMSINGRPTGGGHMAYTLFVEGAWS